MADLEQVVFEDKSSNTNGLLETNIKDGDEETETAENDLEPKSKRARKVRMAVEPLNLICEWDSCGEASNSYSDYIGHIRQEIYEIASDRDEYVCKWKNCSMKLSSWWLLMQHACFHGYHFMLKNIGENMLQRTKLPECTQEENICAPDRPQIYCCEWVDCEEGSLWTIYDFLEHVKMHINANPKVCEKGETLDCGWIGCNCKFTSLYKLIDHVKSHTKEKVVACPTCGSMFSSKTKFCDHRKRQLPLELQSYQCSQCSKLFPTERLLRDHMRSHINHYKCTMCDMTCPKPSILAKHIRHRHISDRPFKCYLCEHTCVTKYNLEIHLLTHCPDKLLSCEVCGFRCRSKCTLDRHYQQMHGAGFLQIYECHCCQKQFPRGAVLTQHLMKQHNYHWPSGHSRFRYKEDTDGIFRLQTVRYESLELTQEMISTSSDDNKITSPIVADNIKYDLCKQNSPGKIPRYSLLISESGEKNIVCSTGNNIMITIDDIDENGRLIRSEVIESKEIVCATDEMKCLSNIQTADENESES